jgi:hypothetical protein
VWVEGSGLVPNTDVKGYLSRDAWTNTLEVTFDSVIAYSTNVNQYLWSSSETNLPGAGSNLLWKIQTLNTNTSGKIRMVAPEAR